MKLWDIVSADIIAGFSNISATANINIFDDLIVF